MNPKPCPPGKTPTARAKTAAPVRKVKAAMIVGAVSTLALAFISLKSGDQLPEGLGEALVYLFTVAAAYIARPAVGEIVVDCEDE